MTTQQATEYIKQYDTFKFPVNHKFIGLTKISHLNELKYLKNLEAKGLEGYKFIGNFNNHYYFSIDTRLSRAIKLAPLTNSVLPHKLKFIMDIIRRSIRVENEETLGYSTNWWIYNNNPYYEDETIKLEKQEQKNKIKYQNNLYNQKLKNKR
jgi:hypothetical protein